MLDKNKMHKTLFYVQELLVNGQYEVLERLTGGNRLSSTAIEQAMEEWPEKSCPDHFIMPSTLSLQDLIMPGGLDPIPGVLPERWMIEMYLWTIEQGQSDLSVRLSIIDAPGKLYQIELDDILVM